MKSVNFVTIKTIKCQPKKILYFSIVNKNAQFVQFVFYVDPNVSYSTWEHRSVSTPVVDNLSRGSKNHLSPDWNQEKLLCLGISALSATMCHFTHDRTYRVSGQEMTKIRRKGGKYKRKVNNYPITFRGRHQHTQSILQHCNYRAAREHKSKKEKSFSITVETSISDNDVNDIMYYFFSYFKNRDPL